MSSSFKVGALACALGVAAITGLGCAGATPTVQCVVYSHSNKEGVAGVAYMRDGKASFREGMARHDVAWMDEHGQVFVVFGSGQAEKAAHYEGGVITIDYIEDAPFASEKVLPDRPIVIRGDFYKTKFEFNEECTETEAVVGAVALFHAVFPDRHLGDPGAPP